MTSVFHSQHAFFSNNFITNYNAINLLIYSRTPLSSLLDSLGLERNRILNPDIDSKSVISSPVIPSQSLISIVSFGGFLLCCLSIAIASRKPKVKVSFLDRVYFGGRVIISNGWIPLYLNGSSWDFYCRNF